MAVSLSVSMSWLVVNQNVNQCWTTSQSDFLVRDWLMMLMMSLTNGGFERRKVRLVLVDEFLSVLYITTYVLSPQQGKGRGERERETSAKQARIPTPFSRSATWQLAWHWNSEGE